MGTHPEKEKGGADTRAGTAAAGATESTAGAKGSACAVPPRREDGSEWPEVDGMKPGDPGYGIMLEQLEWEQRRQRRYSVVLALQIAFIIVLVGVVVYFAVTA